MNIEFIKLQKGQYFDEPSLKRSIVLHHTAGADNIESVLAWWNQTDARVATHFIIDRDGRIVQCMDTSRWAYHLGVKGRSNTIELEKQSIGIELCNWGWVAGGKNYVGGKVDDIYTLDKHWRHQIAFERYAEEQLAACSDLLKMLSDTHNISLANDFTIENWFSVNHHALNGEGGLWTHASFRQDKTDCSPQQPLIEMLYNL